MHVNSCNNTFVAQQISTHICVYQYTYTEISIHIRRLVYIYVDQQTDTVDKQTDMIYKQTYKVDQQTGIVHNQTGIVDQQTGIVDQQTQQISRHTYSTLIDRYSRLEGIYTVDWQTDTKPSFLRNILLCVHVYLLLKFSEKGEMN